MKKFSASLLDAQLFHHGVRAITNAIQAEAVKNPGICYRVVNDCGFVAFSEV